MQSAAFDPTQNQIADRSALQNITSNGQANIAQIQNEINKLLGQVDATNKGSIYDPHNPTNPSNSELESLMLQIYHLFYSHAASGNAPT